MKLLLLSTTCLLLLCAGFAQDISNAKSTNASATEDQSRIPAGVEIALKKYISAYEGRSIQDLLAVWPDLQNQKKEFGKIKQHLNDGNISNEHVSLHPLETQILKDDAIVLCERAEQFAKTETSDVGGDLMMNRSPAQSPPASQTTKTVKNKDKVWVKLHKNNDDWVIESVSAKQLSF